MNYMETIVCSCERARKLQDFGIISGSPFYWCEVAEFGKEDSAVIKWIPALVSSISDDEFITDLPQRCLNEKGETRLTRGDTPALTIGELQEIIKYVIEETQQKIVVEIVGDKFRCCDWQRPEETSTLSDSIANAIADKIINLLGTNQLKIREINLLLED